MIIVNLLSCTANMHQDKQISGLQQTVRTCKLSKQWKTDLFFTFLRSTQSMYKSILLFY